MTRISCGTLPTYGGTSALEYTNRTTQSGDFKRAWQRGIHLIGSTRAYADLFTHLQADNVIPPLRDGGNVLDYGIGTIAFSLALTNVRVQINGMDINPFMYAPPASAARRAGLNVEVFRDAHRLPFAPSHFDLVLSTQRLVAQDTALKEIRRVLRPGSPVIVIVNMSDPLTSSNSSQLIDRMQQAGFTAVRLYNLSDRRSPDAQIEGACIGFKTV